MNRQHSTPSMWQSIIVGARCSHGVYEKDGRRHIGFSVRRVDRGNRSKIDESDSTTA